MQMESGWVHTLEHDLVPERITLRTLITAVGMCMSTLGGLTNFVKFATSVTRQTAKNKPL